MVLVDYLAASPAVLAACCFLLGLALGSFLNVVILRLPVMLEQVRRTYDGPLAMATDYMVFNVTKEDIRVRMAAVDTEIWPTDPTRPGSRAAVPG